MKNNRIIWSDIATSDLNTILDYIYQNSGSERASYVLKGIEDAISHIYPFPYKFAQEEHFNNINVRYLVKWNYKIVYRIMNDYIGILRVFHTAQNPSKIKIL